MSAHLTLDHAARMRAGRDSPFRSRNPRRPTTLHCWLRLSFAPAACRSCPARAAALAVCMPVARALVTLRCP